jgi:uncharacterized protein (TIGR02147 family)
MTIEKDTSTNPPAPPTEGEKLRFETFRQLLQQTLIDRCKRNPAYSLRSFAQSLGVNHAILSLLLRSKRKMTERHVLTIGTKLGLKPQDLSYYIDQLKLEQPLSFESKYVRYLALSPDQFEILTNWFPDAILELMRTKGFQSDPEWIASRLGISNVEAQATLERLERLKMIRRKPDGGFEDCVGDTSTIPFGETTAAAQRIHQKLLLELSAQKIDTVPLEQRSQTSTTLAIPMKKIALAKQMIREFRSKMQRALQEPAGANDEVYQLQVSFFPLTRLEKFEPKISESIVEGDPNA